MVHVLVLLFAVVLLAKFGLTLQFLAEIAFHDEPASFGILAAALAVGQLVGSSFAVRRWRTPDVSALAEVISTTFM